MEHDTDPTPPHGTTRPEPDVFLIGIDGVRWCPLHHGIVDESVERDDGLDVCDNRLDPDDFPGVERDEECDSVPIFYVNREWRFEPDAPDCVQPVATWLVLFVLIVTGAAMIWLTS